MCIGSGVQDNSVQRKADFMDFINDRPLVVTLKIRQFRLFKRPAELLQVGREILVAVDPLFTYSEKV